MAFLTTLRRVRGANWSTATWLVIFSLFLGTIPMWGGFLLARLLSHNVPAVQVIDDGQLVIYSAALLSTGLYFVGKDFKSSAFPGRLGFLLILGILIAVATLLFSGITIADTTTTGAIQIDFSILRYTSIGVFFASIALVFVSSAVNESLRELDIIEQRTQQMSKLESDFDTLSEGEEEVTHEQ